jgi:hypothetical protein
MEYAVVGLVGLLALVLLLPRRRGPAPWLALMKPVIVGGVVLAGWLAYTALSATPGPGGLTADTPHERRTDQTMDYAQGDEELRALLLSQ